MTIKQYCFLAAARVPYFPSRSKWQRGVKHYAMLLLSNASKDSSADEIFKPAELKKLLLGGAENWEQLSSGGGMFPFTVSEIEYILCTKSEQGKLGISALMECQTRAMKQAYIALRNDLPKIINL